MKIPEIIHKKKFFAPEEIKLVKAEVELFLNAKEPSQAEILAQRSKPLFSPVPLEIAFRSRERTDKIRQILQCLVAFLVHIPGTDECDGRHPNPFEQFMGYVLFEVDLLLAEDVKNAVFFEINQIGSASGGNVWDYLRRIIDKNRELNELIITGTSNAASIFMTLCMVLEDLCLFWFDVKQEDLSRIRRSDIFIFELARILQGQCRKP
jgi:hypothetical protein